jgi:hypothetical protein
MNMKSNTGYVPTKPGDLPSEALALTDRWMSTMEWDKSGEIVILGYQLQGQLKKPAIVKAWELFFVLKWFW